VGKVDNRWFGLDRCWFCAKFHGTWSLRFDSCGSIMILAPWHLSLRFDNYGNMTPAPWHFSFIFDNCGSMTMAFIQIW